jgi:PAS domain S-box-containing protein
LRASEEKYRLLYESLRDAFVSVDMSGRILEVNPAFCVLTGYSQEDLGRLTYLDLTPAKWHPAEARIVAEQVMARGYSDVYEKEYVRKDGSRIPIELRTILIRDAAGAPAGMWALVRDLGRRKRIEEALRRARAELAQRVQERTAELVASQAELARSEEQFRQMAASIQEVFWMLDAQTGRTLYVSPAFETIWGRPVGDTLAGFEVWLDTLHPDDRARVQEDFARGVETGEFTPLEYRIRRPDGAVRWIRDNAWALRDAEGRVCRVVGVFHDITERRQLEAGILQAAEAERHRIGRDLHDGLGQALTGMAYLAEAVRVELARKNLPEAGELQRLGELIVTAADQAHSLARGLLLVDVQRGGLNAALQELAARTQSLFGTACRYHGPADIRDVPPDVASQLYCIAQEAATNAAKHNHGGEIVMALDSDAGGLTLTVADSGEGMTRTPGKAARLGLEIMRYRAGLIGAVLTIESQQGRGTCVTCRLPHSIQNQENP